MKKYIIYFACLLAIVWGCNPAQKTDDHAGHNHESPEGHTHADGEDDSVHEDEGADTNEIIFTPEQATSVGLEVVTVKPDKFHQVIKTSGQILSAQGDEVTISATASGIVSFNKSSMNEGLAVKKGETLISVSSKNMVDGDPVTRAKAAYDIAENEFKRAESLIGEKLISQKQYNEIKLAYENAKIAYEAIGQHTSAKGISISTPLSGFIKTKLVSEGQYVDAGQALMVVTQNRKLQLRADVSERYYKDLGNITSANFKTSYDKTVYRLSELNGRIVSYGRSTSSGEYYLPANFEFDNVGQVISGSYVEVYLLGQAKENVISIPLSALTEEQGVYFVYLQIHPDAYRKQGVQIGTSDGSFVEVLSGLKNGDKVVSKGAFHVKLASASPAIPHAHEH